MILRYNYKTRTFTSLSQTNKRIINCVFTQILFLSTFDQRKLILFFYKSQYVRFVNIFIQFETQVKIMMQPVWIIGFIMPIVTISLVSSSQFLKPSPDFVQLCGHDFIRYHSLFCNFAKQRKKYYIKIIYIGLGRNIACNSCYVK